MSSLAPKRGRRQAIPRKIAELRAILPDWLDAIPVHARTLPEDTGQIDGLIELYELG